VTMAVCGVAWLVWGGPDGPSQVLTFRGAKGWQVESIIGLFFHVSDPSGSHPEAGAWRTAAEMPGWGRPLLTALSGLTSTPTLPNPATLGPENACGAEQVVTLKYGG